MNTRTVRLLILLFVSLSFSTQLAAAVIEEMIVTSNKRGAFDAQDLAQAVYGFDGDSMDRKRQVNFEDFAPVVPGLSFQDLGPGDKEYIIRGINGNGPSVVGVYFDEYVISANDQQDGGGKNAPIVLVDLERVEVLNGPQGTLYGANSMAGNIRFIPRKPSTDAMDAYVNTDVSGTENGGFNYLLDGAINIPMGDKFAARLVGWRTDNEGWIDQPRLQTGADTFDGNASGINDEETNGGRIMVLWEPTDHLSIDALYLIQRMEIGGSSRFSAQGQPVWTDISQPIQDLIDIQDPDDQVTYATIPGLPALTPSDDFQNTDITVNTRDDDVDLFGATANLGYDWGTFTLLGSYYKHEILFKFDSTPVLAFNGVGVPGVTVQPQSYETTTAEARFASSFDGFFNFVGGVYYQKDENDFEVNVTTTDNRGNSVPWDELNANDFFAGGTAFFGRFRNDEIEQLGVFGEATFDFLEKWQLAVGARWIDVEIQATQATSHAFVGQLSENLPGELVGHTVNGNEIRLLKQEDDDVIPKVSLSFRATDEVLLYGLYSEGFRVGGVNNANQPFAPGIPPTFKSDNLQNIEFGIKSQWFDERMQINAALFMIDWEDIQVEPRDPLSNIPFTTNGGEAEVNGLEWSITGIPVNYIELMFTGTYFFDHQLTTDQPPLLDASPYVITGLAGDEIPNVPEFQLYWAGTWEGQMASRPLLLTLDATYRDSTNTEFRTDSPFNFKLDSYVVLNTYANYHVTDNISVGLYVKNLTDELALYDGIGTFENPQAVVSNRPRTWGATFTWKLQ
jgi:outer membrane receptor protein involved in Fe transport